MKAGKMTYRAIAAIAMMVAALTLTGCSTIREVPVPRVEYRDSVRVVAKVDSVVIRDSVYIRDKGDTIRVERWRYRDVWRLRVDTIAVAKVDTMTTIVEVERSPTAWEKVRLAAFPWLLAVAVAAVLYVAIKIWNFFK